MNGLGRAQIFCRPFALDPMIWTHVVTEPMTLPTSFKESSEHHLPCLCTGRHVYGSVHLHKILQTNFFWKYQWQMAAQQREGCNGGSAHRDKLLMAAMGNFFFYCFVSLPIATHCFIANLSFITAEQHLHHLWQPAVLLKPISSRELGAVVLSALMSDLCNNR